MKRNLLRIKYKITGGKLDYLPTLLHSRKISVFFTDKLDDNTLSVTIDFCDRNKFFAICKNMCYNKLIIGFYGVLSPLAYLCRNIGAFLGIITFCITCAFLGDFLLGIDCEGSGACFKSQTQFIAEMNGAIKYSRISNVDLKNLETEILKTNPMLSFVSVKKQGNRLVINSILSNKQPNILSENTSSLISEYNGIVESMSVLRGTALVKVGDVVEKGTELVGAYLTGKEDKTYPTYVLARITIISTESRFIPYDGEVDDAVLKSAERVAEFESVGKVISAKAEKCQGGIIINLKVRHTIDAVS